MGLIQEVQNLNNSNKQLQNEYIKAQKEAEKATKKAEELAKKLEFARQEKEQKREFERDIKKAIEKDFTQYLKVYINKTDYKKAIADLYTIETRTNIINKFATNELEFDFLNENYERILNKIKKIYENDQNAKNELITQQLKEELQKSNNVEIAKKFGYDDNKIYTLENIYTLKNNIQTYIKNQQKQKKQETKNIIFNLIVFFAYAFMIGIIPFLFFYGYFTIAK